TWRVESSNACFCSNLAQRASIMNFRRLASIIFATAVSMAAPSFSAEATKESLAEVKKAIDDKKAVLVDVREKREWDSGHVEGAIFLPLSELKGSRDAERLKAKLPKDKIIYTHCAVGKRAIT